MYFQCEKNQNLKSFKRKRKIVSDDVSGDSDSLKKYKDLMHIDNESPSQTDISSNSTTPLYGRYASSCGASSTEESMNSELKKELLYSTDKSLDNMSIKETSRSSMKNIEEDDEKDTFCVDMGRFKNFNHSAAPSQSPVFNLEMLGCSNNIEIDVKSHNIADNNKTRNTTVTQKLRSKQRRTQANDSRFSRSTSGNHNKQQNNRRNSRSNQIFRPHEHKNSIPHSQVPCKGPACKTQICCAQYCSQKCFNNHMSPLGSGVNYKSSNYETDVVSTNQADINVTDYGLFYPDHTYCRDHRDIYFTADARVYFPPYADLVENLFYAEKEARIKNPRPQPNCHGDPIPATEYVAPAKRGRPNRSHLSGLLEPYVFHPSSDVVYIPFIFKEPIIDADHRAVVEKSIEPLVNAIRTSSNLYKDFRRDIPREILHNYNVPNIYSDYSSNSQVYGSKDQMSIADEYSIYDRMYDDSTNKTHDPSNQTEDGALDLPCTAALEDLFEQTNAASDFQFS